MRKEDCFYLGHISRVHGLKGEVIAVFDTDQNEKYRDLESVLVSIHDELVPFFIEQSANNSKGHFILAFEDIDHGQAEKLVGKELYLPLEVLPPLSGKAFYFHEVVGFDIIDVSAGLIGKCNGINDSSAQALFEVIDSANNQILIPAVDDYIVSINRDQKEITVQCPPGLIDIFKKDDPGGISI